MTDDDPDPVPPPAKAVSALLGKFNPWMLPVLYVVGGGALSIGGMTIAVEREEHTAEECAEADECEECEECEECPEPSRRRADLQADLEEAREDMDELEHELERATTANDALLSQLTTLSASCAQ